MAAPSTTDRGPAPPERFQFRIRDLLILMLLVGLAVGAAVQQSVVLFFALIGASLYCLHMWKKWWPPAAIEVVAVAAGGILLLLLLLPAVGSRPAGPKATCGNNMRMILIALEQYHADYGTFPPAYIADKDGRPMHSWRVLILPYIEQSVLYGRYRFDEPWDGPNNRKLADLIIKSYTCPKDQPTATTETSYVAVTGPGTAWPGEGGLARGSLKDGPGNVILIVEVHNSGIHCMEPRDLHVTQMATTINPKHGQGVSSAHTDGAWIGMADGAVRFLKDDTPQDVLRSHIQIDDGTIPLPP
jgi:hypothetical protein